eukprot:7391723-Prymnesium_polylepis.3
MVPHYALQGSCQVPSYHVLANTAGWTIDQMERLTYDLCYLHFKCNRPISVPVPIYYADKAAARGAHLIDAQHNLIEATDAAIERLKCGRVYQKVVWLVGVGGEHARGGVGRRRDGWSAPAPKRVAAYDEDGR